MPLVTTTEMFKKAYEGGYAIGAFNVNNMEIVQGIVDAAKEEQSPLILQVSAGARKYAKHIYLVKLVEAALEDSNLPIALHLDHGDSFEICKDCVDGGFTSVMIDASHHDFDENVRITKQVVEYAHARGVSVEAELGRVGGQEDHVVAETMYADPEECRVLVEKTGIDCLAPALGSVHGPYHGEPKLGFDEMAYINNLLKMPLVLHGGSGIPDEMIKKAITLGVSKVNVNTECQLYFQEATRKYIEEGKDQQGKGYDPRKLLAPGFEAIKATVKEKMELFGSVNKA